jgi:hypothetical protein
LRHDAQGTPESRHPQCQAPHPHRQRQRRERDGTEHDAEQVRPDAADDEENGKVPEDDVPHGRWFAGDAAEMKIALLVAKTVISLLVAVTPIVLLWRDWRHRDKRTSNFKIITKAVLYLMLCSMILTISMLWLEPYWQIQIIKQERACLRPDILLKIREINDTNVELLIAAPATNDVPIDELFYKFEIPGKYLNSVVKADKMDNYEISPFVRQSLGEEVISEVIRIHCKSIFPQGGLRINIVYVPTRSRLIPGSLEAGRTNDFVMPVMDLHNWTRCLYSWQYSGISQLECKYYCLTNLNYFLKNNTNMLATCRQDGFFEDIYAHSDPNNPTIRELKEYQRSVTNQYTEKWRRDFEEERKDW